MKYHKTLFVVISLVAASFVRADVAPAKRAEIEKLLQLTGMTKMVDQMKAQMIASIRQSQPQAPAEFWDKFSEKMDARQLIEKIIPIYDKYYTVDDLKAVNQFYASPAGQKIISTLPNVMQESMRAGQEWGAQISQEAAQEVQAEAAAKK